MKAMNAIPAVAMQVTLRFDCNAATIVIPIIADEERHPMRRVSVSISNDSFI